MPVILYLLTIIAANVLTAKFSPLEVGIFLIPFGTFLIGLTFVFRDLTQNKLGRKKTYFVILLALILSAISSYLLGDGLYIVLASLIAFLTSETTDTEIYTRLKLKMEYRVLYSGLVGGLLDSIVFVVIGLSPIGLHFLEWNQVILAICGQVFIKSFMQFVALFFIKLARMKTNSKEVIKGEQI